MPPIPHKSDGYHVFLASPNDMKAERQLVRDFFVQYNRDTAKHKGLRFTVVDWEHYASTGIGRPQELITKQTLDPHRDSLVLFVGIMGMTFGSPTGTHPSGTDEEFQWALNTNREQGFPEIKWFFQKYDGRQIPEEPKAQRKALSQWEKVYKFHKQREKGGLCREFADTDEFAKKIASDLTEWLNNPDRPWNASLASAKPRPARKKADRPREPSALPPAQREKLLADYLHTVIGKTQDLPLHGLYSPKGEQLRVPLERVFVSLKAMPTRTDDAEDPGRSKARLMRRGADEGETAALTMEATLKVHRHLVILGSPGSGKTTLSQYVALCYAQDRVPGSTSTWVRDRLQLEERGYVPLLFLLRDVGKHLKKHAPVDDGVEGAARLLEFFHLALQENHHPLPEEFFKEDLQSGRAVVLLDGMDELGDPELRRRVARMIENFALAYPRCRILVTSRIVGYEGAARVGGNFATTTIANFSADDVRLFLQQWHGHVAELTLGPGEDAQREAQTQTDGLLSEIDANARVGELAVNPLILTVIALLHRENVKLPERRVDLYTKVTELLLGERDRLRGVDGGAVFERLPFDLEERQEVFQVIAIKMHTQTAEEITHDDLNVVLTTDFVRRTTERSAVKRAVKRFLSGVLERTGLLVDAGSESYRFAHLSFQEYLVARQMAESETYFADTLARLADPFWREVILLEFACLAKERRNLLLPAIAAAPEAQGNTQALHNLVLAADCLHDAGLGKVDATVLAELRHKLQSVVELPLPKVKSQEKRRVFAVRRVTAAQALGRIADDAKNADDAKSAQEALALEHPYWSVPYGEPQWVTIPAGEFSMGSAPEDDLAYDDEKPPHRVFVSEFRLARTPVTNVQYWLYVQETGARTPLHWRGKSPAREMWTHPVVYVSWGDVQAYCAWLAAKIGKPVRLPTEAEWEKAARGDRDTRRYPWGDQFDVARCNSGELWRGTEAGGTSPVGIFPEGASPYGCLDMSGNVLEWCHDGQRTYTSARGSDPFGPTTAGAGRVVRGGRWYWYAQDVRSAYRNARSPGYRDDLLGFRCASSS